MRKRFQIIQILLIVLFVMLPALSLAADKIQLTLMEYAPLIGEKVKGYGIEPAIVTAAFEQVNIDVEYGVFPRREPINRLKRGYTTELSDLSGQRNENNRFIMSRQQRMISSLIGSSDIASNCFR